MSERFFETFARLVDDGHSYVFLLPIYAALLGGEWVAHQFLSDRRWNYRDGAANIAITAAMLALDVLVGKLLPLGVFALLHEHARVFTLGDGTAGWLLAFLLYDLAWYIDHRIAHRTGLLWAFHHVHHSSTEYNMTVASRGFLGDKPLVTRPLFYLLPILGMSVSQFVAVAICTNIWGIAQHTRLVGRLGPLEWIFATPSNHRVHHGSDPKYLDRNYGEVLIVWDRLFGTYRREEEEPTYGVTEPLDTYNPLRIQVAGIEWLRKKMAEARNGWERLACLVRPPEWHPAPAGVSGQGASAPRLRASGS